MYQKTVLPSGIRVVTSNMPHARSVSTSIFIGTGSRYEKKQERGVSHFLEHMLFKGTAKRPTSRELSEAIEGVGGIHNGETDKELTVFWSKVAKPHFALSLDVLTDMVLHSKFQQEEIEKERQVVVEEINRSKDSPSQEVDTITDEILFPGHSLGLDILGTKRSVGGLTQETMLDYIARQYIPASTVFAIAGNVIHEQIAEAVAAATCDWHNTHKPARYKPFVEQPNPRLRVQYRDTEQAHVCLALPGISLQDPRRFALDLLNVVLGGGMSSRLFIEIRDKLGLAYAIHSYIDHYLDTGAFIVYAGIQPAKLTVVVKAVLEQLARLKDELVPEIELTKAKELSKGRILLRMEDSYAVSGWLGGQEVLTGKIMSVDEVLNKIDALTARDARNIARELLVSDKLRLAVVGPVQEKGLDNLLKI